jgi:hypothetical protein
MSTINGHVHDFHEHDRMAYIAPGEMDRVEEFRFDLVDQRLSGKQPTEPPSNHYREAAMKFFPFLDQCLSFIMQYPDAHLAAWVVAIAAGRNSLSDGATQQDLADKFGITKAAVNKCVKALQARLGNSIDGIEPMGGQRKIESCRKFARVRNQQINHHTENENSKK